MLWKIETVRSHSENQHAQKIAIFLWVFASTSILVYIFYLQYYKGGGEIMAIPMYMMLAINFPISIVSVSLIAFVYMTLAINGLPDDQYLLVRSLFDWLVMASFGYLQWFVLLPIVWRKLRGIISRK